MFSTTNKNVEALHILSSSNSFTAVIRWGVLTEEPIALNPEHPRLLSKKGFPGECPTISKQSPGWISSLALKPCWRMRIWVAHESGLQRQRIARHVLSKISLSVWDGAINKKSTKSHLSCQRYTHNCTKLHVQPSSVFWVRLLEDNLTFPSDSLPLSWNTFFPSLWHV